jgi:alpha-L-rhamnosidase
MTSFNHYAFGSIINWLHSVVGGVSPLSPGWKEINVQPVPGGSIDSAEVVYETPYGRLECRWAVKASEKIFSLELLVPPNSCALITLPSDGSDTEEKTGTRVGSGHHHFSVPFSWEQFSREWPPKPRLPFMRRPQPDTIA